MDLVLCDELIIEIFQRIPPSASSSNSIPLVSKRWLRLWRHSRTSLSLLLLCDTNTLASLLRQHPYLTSLSLSSTSSSPLPATPLLHSLSSACPNLTRLSVPLPRPLDLSSWLPSLPSLNHLSLTVTDKNGHNNHGTVGSFSLSSGPGRRTALSYLSVSGLAWEDAGLGWVWRGSPGLRKLRLRNCEGVGDGGSLAAFSSRLAGLAEVELRSCRAIADRLLVQLGDHAASLASLLVHDGGSRDGLLYFINGCAARSLRRLDLRLPLDLDNEHLSAMAGTLSRLASLRLESCCLVTGNGLRDLGSALGGRLEELALVNCDVVERVPGLLTAMGQSLRGLRRLDLSYNEMMVDKELVSMLISCDGLLELKLRGCKGLTSLALVSLGRICKGLTSVDVVGCRGIDGYGVELFLSGVARLRELRVEEGKVSDAARAWASKRFVRLTV